uniref:ZP domain-containing protein n=1 Tax=Romanomermis culicivorax TaxID=13658 RepID=A0A915JCP3_ROMCU
MDVKLKDRLPPPRNGMWTLEVEDHPHCPSGAAETDVGGGYEFTIFYADKDLCGVQPVSWFTPNWLSYAETTLILNDANGTKIADSISCIYNTRFDTSLMTFKGETTSENLRYGGSLDDEGTDVETVVESGKAVNMDFYEGDGSPLASNRKVKLGDQLLFRIDVSSSNHVSKILPETCYFSSSSQPDENLINGQTLPFVKKNCFNWKNGMVKAFLQPMERNNNGTLYQLAFPAFYFTDYGRNLYVHCTILACIGDQKLCEPKPNYFDCIILVSIGDQGLCKPKPKSFQKTIIIMKRSSSVPNVSNFVDNFSKFSPPSPDFTVKLPPRNNLLKKPNVAAVIHHKISLPTSFYSPYSDEKKEGPQKNLYSPQQPCSPVVEKNLN